MALDLGYINERIRSDAEGYVEECEAEYAAKIHKAAVSIADNIRKSPLVLLSGPSGSGKTTTAKRIDDALKVLGINAHNVSLDDYFISPKTYGMPRTPEGDPDFESPDCIDWPLLNTHFDGLETQCEIHIPHFSFSLQRRVAARAEPMCLNSDEIAIFEGIHALNTRITGRHPDAFKLYISARSDTLLDGKLVFKGTWTRLVRRAIRDDLFRASDASVTLAMWANVRRGEKAYISPFKDSADLQLDTAIGYEIPAMRDLAREVFAKAPQGAERYDELTDLLASLDAYADFDTSLVPPVSMIREFIGGGIYKY
ncbi:MAG: nucleoside kinase [Oscillospiraceae bacterium]|jgi:uridine kinase|nr:nucleoside kinase [Oscillospiraceae bacterium]